MLNKSDLMDQHIELMENHHKLLNKYFDLSLRYDILKDFIYQNNLTVELKQYLKEEIKKAEEIGYPSEPEEMLLSEIEEEPVLE